jgi:cobalt/nickel transport system permease protein
MMTLSHHDEMDRFAKGSRFFLFDARVKLISTIAVIITAAFLRDIQSLLVLLAFVILELALAAVPAHHIAENYLLALPFIAVASLALAFTSTLLNAEMMFIRVSASVLALILLTTTTPFFEMMAAFRWFRMPKILNNLILFTYRFIFVLQDEAARMKMARKARGFTGGRHLFERHAFRTLSNSIGMIFVRSSQRGSDMFDALLMRGYNGNVRTIRKPKVHARDGVLVLIVGLACTISILVQNGVIAWR